MSQATLETRTDGYFCQVGDAGKFFPIKQFVGYHDAQQAALSWIHEQSRFQNAGYSLDQCVVCVSRLYELAMSVADGFPRLNTDFRFVIDEHFRSVAVIFGSLIVTGSERGFNIELVTNWLTKRREIICTDVPFEVAKSVILNSPASQMFSDLEAQELFLSDFNREILHMICVVE